MSCGFVTVGRFVRCPPVMSTEFEAAGAWPDSTSASTSSTSSPSSFPSPTTLSDAVAKTASLRFEVTTLLLVPALLQLFEDGFRTPAAGLAGSSSSSSSDDRMAEQQASADHEAVLRAQSNNAPQADQKPAGLAFPEAESAALGAEGAVASDSSPGPNKEEAHFQAALASLFTYSEESVR